MRATLLLPLLLLAACPGPTPAPVTPVGNNGTNTGGPAVQLATLERGPCFGFCPVYKVAVFTDGTVEYEGDKFVKLTGPHEGKIGLDKVSALRDLFEKSGYAQWQDAYEQMTVTDLPTAVTSYTKDGSTKTIRHYLGDRTAPPQLTEVEDGFDKIIEIQQWIGTDEERQEIRRQGAP